MIQKYPKEIKIVSIIFLFKLLILSLLPLTGDEVYFISWANNLSSGYYDHPPMVGWLIYLMSFISDHFLYLRMFSVITTFIVAYSIYKIAALYINAEKAFFIGLLFLASPVDILISLFTNDIPLVLFGTLGTLFLLYSFEKEKKTLYAILAGIFLGFAFLSKYFAAFLLISLLVFVFIRYKTKAFKNVAITAFIILLAIAQNLYFNYNSCWNNIMFNFFARTASEYSFETVANLFLNMIYLITPWGIYFLYKARKNFVNSDLLKLLVSILSLMFVIFFIVSLKNDLGIHWFILFVPYIFLLFSFLDERDLKKMFKYNFIFTMIHIGIILSVLLGLKTATPKMLVGHKNYSDVVLATEHKSVCNSLEKYRDREIFTVGYTTAAMLSYACKQETHMLFNSSKFGRLDDKLVDVRELDKKDLYIFDNRVLKSHEFDNVCSSVEIETFEIKKATFYMAKCNDFSYEKYKKIHLDLQKKKFYTIPEWLPVGKCYFLDRYYK